MRPSLSALVSQSFDVAIVGGGINGLAIAWDAAVRGLSVVLVERADFGSGASHGCFRIAHGGLRYLQHFDLARLRESVREQRFLRLAAPHLVAPFPFLVPCYGFGMRGREMLRLGLSIYEAIGAERNSGLAPEVRLPAHRVLSATECLTWAPHLRGQGLRGGVVYYDCQLSTADRLTIEVALAAVRAGACLRNYTAVVGVTAEDSTGGSKQISSLSIKDGLTGEEAEVRAKQFVFASGVANERLESLVHGAPLERSRAFSKGVQLLLPKIIQDAAVALESSWSDPGAVVARGNRSYFLVPWHGKTIAGTYDVAHRAHPDFYQITDQEIEQFVSELHSQYPHEALTSAAVCSVFGGLRPIDVTTENQGTPAVSRRDLVIDHRKQPAPRQIANLITSEGVKYTTFRLIGEWVVDKIMVRLGKRVPSTTSSLTLPYADGEAPARFMGFSEKPSTIEYQFYLRSHFGAAASAIRQLAGQHPRFSEQIVADHPAQWAELVYSFKHELTGTLSDLFYRRSVLGALGLVTPEIIAECTEVLAIAEGWGREQQEAQLTLALHESSPFMTRNVPVAAGQNIGTKGGDRRV